MEQRKIPNTPGTCQRQKQIEDCLYENLLQKPYHNISVSDLCKQVGISRKAFYNYYPSKDACFCAILDRAIQDSVLRLTLDTNDPVQVYTAYLEYWKGQKPFLDTIVRNGLIYLFLQQSLHHVMTEERTLLDMLNTPMVKSDTDILNCCMITQFTLQMQWYSRGFDTPAREMAIKCLRLLYLPMFQMPEEEK